MDFIERLIIKAELYLNINSLDEQNKKGETKLMKCVYSSNIKSVKMLIEKKANLDIQDQFSQTALTIYCGNEKITRMLIEAKANLDVQNCEGNTALMVRAFCSKTSSTEKEVEMLIDAKANLDVQNNRGYTALDILHVYNKQSYLIKKLLKLNASHDTKELFELKCDMYNKQLAKRYEFINKCL